MLTKSVYAFLLGVLLPVFAATADHCDTPDLYKTDKRCYVANVQKTMTPYNAVVGLFKKDGAPFCTGTIIKYDNHLYVYTAKHCVADDSGRVSNVIQVRLQNGQSMFATRSKIGNYTASQSSSFGGDWAIYNIRTNNNVPYVGISNNGSKSNADARVIGYGSLKILSDAEIKKFKSMYLSYLKQKTGLSAAKLATNEYGFKNGGLNTQNSYVHNFIYKALDPTIRKDMFFDSRNLKVATCGFSKSGGLSHCQVWGGNSGGGVFDSDGDIMGIMTRASLFVGGTLHGMGGDAVMF